MKKVKPTRFEVVPKGEAKQIEEIAELTVKLLEQRYPDSMARRGVHPKSHGCVKATFTINDDIPEDLSIGVFSKPGHSYQAWVRYSNATAVITNDVDNEGKATSRGIAIKLMGVEGEPLLDDVTQSTQDFMMINQPVFAFGDVADYLQLTQIQLKNKEDIREFFAVNKNAMKTLPIIGQIQADRMANPLEAQYFSAAPFMLGDNLVVKYSVKPRDESKTPMPENPAPDFLRQALINSLDENTGSTKTFDFMLQVRTDDSLEIEDATALWDESVAPFIKVATMTIEPQNIDNPLRVTECEHMTFSPWHAMSEHQPIGGINRLRMAAYLASSAHRLAEKEPTGYSKWG